VNNSSIAILVYFSINTNTEAVKNKKLQDRLYNALNKSKPLQYFECEIDNSGEYRQKWLILKIGD